MWRYKGSVGGFYNIDYHKDEQDSPMDGSEVEKYNFSGRLE